MGFHTVVWGRVADGRMVLVSLVAGLLTGCAPMLLDDPDLNLQDAYTIAPSHAGQLDVAWRAGFDDPVLHRLIAAAMNGNPGLGAARARLRAADAEARAAGAPVTGTGDVNVNLNEVGTDVATAGLGARLDPGRAARRAAAVARAEAARFDANDARRLLIEELVTTYVDLRYFQQLLEYRRADVASRRHTLSELEKLLAAGAVTELDVVSARALLVEARGQLPSIEAEALRQRNMLSALVGQPVSTLDINLAFARSQPVPRGSVDHGVPANLLRARPDIGRAERLYAAAIADIEVSRADLYPSLTLSGRIQMPLEGGAEATSLVPGLSIPVFGRDALHAGVEASEARAAAAFEQWRGAVLAAVEQLESALAARAAAERAATASAEVVSLQRRALDLARRLLVSGDITALDILDREQAVSAARAALAQNRRDVALAHVALLAAVGLEQAAAGHPEG